MLNLIVNESINKDTPAQYQVATDVILTHNTSILCEHWFKEKGIIQNIPFTSYNNNVLIIEMSLNVAFNYGYQKTLLFREVYHYKSSYLKTLAKKAFTIGGECNVIVQDSEPIRLLESPRSPR